MSDFWSFGSNASNGTRDLYILKEIESRESWWSDCVTPKRFISQLNNGSGDVSVWIDSPGGDCFAGAAIYEALRSYSTSGKGKVYVNILGLAASAAGLIAMAGDEVRISLVGTFMLHDPWSGVQGNARKLRTTADVLDEIREGQIRAYMRKSGKTHDEVMALIKDQGTYMNAQTAVQNGFADSILNEDESSKEWLDAVNSMRVSSCLQREADHIGEFVKSCGIDKFSCEATNFAIGQNFLQAFINSKAEPADPAEPNPADMQPENTDNAPETREAGSGSAVLESRGFAPAGRTSEGDATASNEMRALYRACFEEE